MTHEEALLKVREYLTKYLPTDRGYEVDEIITTLETPKWIPVSEKLPEPVDPLNDERELTDWVLVTIRLENDTTDVGKAYYSFVEQKWYISCTSVEGEITAWMPPLKPYKERWLENAKDTTEEVYEYITKEADGLGVDRKLYYERVIQYMRDKSEEEE